VSGEHTFGIYVFLNPKEKQWWDQSFGEHEVKFFPNFSWVFACKAVLHPVDMLLPRTMSDAYLLKSNTDASPQCGTSETKDKGGRD